MFWFWEKTLHRRFFWSELQKWHSSTPFSKIITKSEIICICKTVFALCVAISKCQLTEKNKLGVIVLSHVLPVFEFYISTFQYYAQCLGKEGRLVIFMEIHTKLLIISFSSLKKCFCCRRGGFFRGCLAVCYFGALIHVDLLPTAAVLYLQAETKCTCSEWSLAASHQAFATLLVLYHILW